MSSTIWIRECQECGYKQRDTQPEYGKPLSLAYANRKCKKCKSEALDYGREVENEAATHQ